MILICLNDYQWFSSRIGTKSLKFGAHSFVIQCRIEIVNTPSGYKNISSTEYLCGFLCGKNAKGVVKESVHFRKNRSENRIAGAQAIEAKFLFFPAGILVLANILTKMFIRTAVNGHSIPKGPLFTDIHLRGQRPGSGVKGKAIKQKN